MQAKKHTRVVNARWYLQFGNCMISFIFLGSNPILQSSFSCFTFQELMEIAEGVAYDSSIGLDSSGNLGEQLIVPSENLLDLEFGSFPLPPKFNILIRPFSLWCLQKYSTCSCQPSLWFLIPIKMEVSYSRSLTLIYWNIVLTFIMATTWAFT